MKRIYICLAAVLIAGLCLVALQKQRQADAARAEALAAAQQLKAAQAQAAQLNSKSKKLQSQLHDTRSQVLEKTAETHELKQALTEKEAQKSAAPNHKTVFRDPEMKAALQQQAASAAARMVKSMFDGGLADYLKLNDTQTESLKQLMSQKASIFWDQIMIPMATGELPEGDMAATGRAIKAAFDANSQQMRALLGDQGYGNYQWFETTQAERDRLTMFIPKFNDAGQPLSAEQQAQLSNLMVREHSNFQFTFDLGNPAKMDFEHLYDNFTEAKINQFAQEMAQLNNRIQQQAQSVLTPEQAALFQQMLAQQLQQSKFTARMTTAMFGKHP